MLASGKATALPCTEVKSFLTDAEFKVMGTAGPQLIPAAIQVSLHSSPHALNTKRRARRQAQAQQGLYSAQKLLIFSGSELVLEEVLP